MKRESQLERIQKNQNKADCFVSVGDIVKITYNNGYSASAVIMDYDLKKETTTKYKGLHPCMGIGVLPYDEIKKSYADIATIWIENIVELEVLKFHGEKCKNCKDYQSLEFCKEIKCKFYKKNEIAPPTNPSINTCISNFDIDINAESTYSDVMLCSLNGEEVLMNLYKFIFYGTGYKELREQYKNDEAILNALNKIQLKLNYVSYKSYIHKETLSDGRKIVITTPPYSSSWKCYIAKVSKS